ncbi:uncharacterized protein C18orf63 homolog [Chanos chanos]|uniref:Uncharacterized protein C18orf63 homolog n=1 Tax=Chanos chanos TaxID=29144 RepID=A0A6J2UTT9_CHACN|nr:uncharacterized protein C18orf63 homolog [Chanos chanos]
MSGGGEQSLFFVSLPDPRKLCCVTLYLQSISDEGELRNRQIKSCRDLLFLYSDVIASPVLGSSGGVMTVMAITFFKRGIIQAYAQRHGLQLGAPQRVLPVSLQACLSYSLIARLAPRWNKAGQFLIAGKDFLSVSGKLNAVVLEMSVTENQLCISVQASAVRLPPATLEDFDLPPLVVRNFLTNGDAVVNTDVSNNWCYILPSMKKGQIVSISHRIPAECPFQSYPELRAHWSSMYGYVLPAVGDENMVYCGVYFKLVGKRLFTYPLCCVRTQPVQRFPRVDLQGALMPFISELRAKLEGVCGFPVRMTSKPCYHTSNLSRPTLQVQRAYPVNLTTKTSSRPVLTKLPSTCPQSGSHHGAGSMQHLPSQPERSQHSQTSKQGSVENTHRLESPLGCNTERGWLSSSTSPSIIPSSSVSCHSQTQAAVREPKLIPIFKNRTLPRHVNVTKILAEKRQTAAQRHSVPASAVKRALSPSSLSSSSSSTPLCSASDLPCLSVVPPWFSRPSLDRVSLSRLEEQNRDSAGRDDLQQPSSLAQTQALTQIPSSRGGEVFESKPKRSKSNVQDVDVEKYARNSQLAKVNSATLQAWLRSRGVVIRSKDRKEELVSKVMQCLNEP